MTTTTTEHTTTAHWAEEAGAKVAARRAAREAEQRAEAEAETGRLALPVDVLKERFKTTGTLLLDAVDLFGRAAEIEISADPVSAISVQLHAGDDTLTLARQDAGVVVTFRSPSRSEQLHVDLDDAEFSAETVVQRIATQWFKQIEATQEGPTHVHAR